MVSGIQKPGLESLWEAVLDDFLTFLIQGGGGWSVCHSTFEGLDRFLDT